MRDDPSKSIRSLYNALPCCTNKMCNWSLSSLHTINSFFFQIFWAKLKESGSSCRSYSASFSSYLAPILSLSGVHNRRTLCKFAASFIIRLPRGDNLWSRGCIQNCIQMYQSVDLPTRNLINVTIACLFLCDLLAWPWSISIYFQEPPCSKFLPSLQNIEGPG